MKAHLFIPGLTIACLVLFGSATAARAVDYQVSTAQELQDALTLAAANGTNDTITITNGYYVGNFNYNSSEDRDLTIQAASGVPNTDIAIDGDGGGRALNITCSGTNVAVTVQGITFLRDCGSSSLYALRIDAGASGTVNVDDCRFLSPTGTSGSGLEIVEAQEANVISTSASGSGKGIDISGVSGAVVVQSCTLSSNTSGGLTATAGASINVSSNSFLGNNGGTGTGAYLQASSGGAGSISVRRNTFAGNWTANGPGAGLRVYGRYAGSIGIDGNTFNENWTIASQGGGGLYLDMPFAGSLQTAVVSNNLFRGNSAPGGGGLSASASSTGTNDIPLVIGNHFEANTATGSSGIGGGARVNGLRPFVVGNTFVGNSGPSGAGVYFSVSTAGNGTLSLNIFESNTASRDGGAIYASGSDLIISDNLVTGNSQSGGSYSGGGVYVNASGTLDFLNNTISQNNAVGGGGGVRFEIDGVVEILNVFNNIIWDNIAGGSGGDVLLTGTGASKTFQYNNAHDLSGVWTLITSNIDLDPEFFDPVNGDFHIQGTSPCKDAGTNGVANLSTTDLDNEPRIADSTVDMGAYEFSTAGAHPADVDTNFVLTPTEFTDYAAAWKSGQTWSNPPVVIPADYLTRAGYLMTNGGTYYNDGSARPVNWKVGP